MFISPNSKSLGCKLQYLFLPDRILKAMFGACSNALLIKYSCKQILHRAVSHGREEKVFMQEGPTKGWRWNPLLLPFYVSILL